MKRLSILVIFILLAIAIPARAQAPTESPEAGGDPLGGATEFAVADERTDIVLMLDWVPNTNHIGAYVAQAKGYYDEANLNVEIQMPGDVLVDQVVAAGTAQFGISYQEGFTYYRAEGLPIVSVAAIIQHNTSGFATLGDLDPVSTPADLAGLRYGSFGSAIERPILDALIGCGGESNAESVEFIDIGFTEPFPLMQRDQVDFVWLFYAWDGIRAEQQGLNPNFVLLQDYTECVPDYYTPILITSQAMIDENPDQVAAFVQATARGYADAISDPAGAAEILITSVPELDADLVRASTEWLSAQYMSDAPRWGEQRAEIWENFTNFMVESGALAEPIDLEGVFTNEFLPGSVE
jgi:ABC-type nitrate/sulfonate/bicarbonate transport system substrate-binding protein